ncbi:MAG: PDZ domain-containing protein, partial [Verrucomicrobiota bacterium]|nr:PDZ domain-containing protein [Verrucomicrobiota bacterium]
QAGLIEGDHLLSIDNRPINSVTDVPTAVFFTRANQFTSIKVRRAASELEFSVKTRPRPNRAPVSEISDSTPNHSNSIPENAVTKTVLGDIE